MTQPVLPMIQPHRFEQGQTKLIAGVQRRHNFSNLLGLPAQWMEFGQHYGKVPGQVGKRAYGVSSNMDQSGLDYLAGVEVSSAEGLPQGFSHIRLEPQPYAVFQHQGHISAIGATHTAIWREWLPQSGKQPAMAPNFELYLEDYNPLMGTGGVEIWIPLKA